MKQLLLVSVLFAIGRQNLINAVDCNNPPPRTDIKDCCPHESYISKDINGKCKKFLDVKPPPQAAPAGAHPAGQAAAALGSPTGQTAFPQACYLECALNEMGFLQNQVLDLVKLKSYLTSVLNGNAELIPIAQNAATKCVDTMKDVCLKMPPSPPGAAGKPVCKPCAAIMLHCLELRTMLDCPVKLWKNDPACVANREFLRTCNPK